MDDVAIKLLEQPLDQQTREQITALWARCEVAIPDIEQRLAEVRGVAMVSDNIVGVSTAGLVVDSLTQQRFLTLRAITDPAFRSHNSALLLVYAVGQSLHHAYLRGARGSEVGAILQYENLAIVPEDHPLRQDRENNPSDPKHNFMAGGCRIGFDNNGMMCSVMYYPNVDIVPPKAMPRRSVDRYDDLSDHATVLLRNYDYDVRLPSEAFTSTEQTELATLWSDAGVFTDPDAMQTRLPFVRCLVRHNGHIIGSASVINEPFPALRSHILRIRVFLIPGHRHRDLEAEVVKAVFRVYENQFQQSPTPGAPPGMSYWVSADQITGSELKAVQPINHFWCAGFNEDGAMRRLLWFRGATQKLVNAASSSSNSH